MVPSMGGSDIGLPFIQDRPALTGLTVVTGFTRHTYPHNPHYIRIDQDCNEWAEKTYMHICYKLGPPKESVLIVEEPGEKWNRLAARIVLITPIAYIHSCIACVYKLQIVLFLLAPILQGMVAVRLVEISSCSAVNCKSVYIIIILMATHTLNRSNTI